MVFRPLLKFYREEIEKIFTLEKKWKVFEDETNEDDRFLRNRIRKWVVPFLLKEGLDPNKLYDNFHEEEFTFLEIRKYPSYLVIHNHSLKEPTSTFLKEIIDIHLNQLGCHPIKRKLLFELKKLLEGKKAFTLKNSEIFFWKSQKSHLYLIPTNSKVFEKPIVKINSKEIIVQWNNLEYKTNIGYEVIHFSPGMTIYNGKIHKEISEIFREKEIPVMVRSFFPILAEDNKPLSILFNLWDTDLKKYP